MDSLPKTLSEVPIAIPSDNLGKKMIVFGTPICPDCTRVKKFLTDNAIEYEYRDLTLDKLAFKWVNSFSKIVPVIVMPDQSILYEPSNALLFEKIKNASVNQKIMMIEPEIFDTIIIGAGPAGLSAAIYAVRKSLKILLITKEIGGQAALSGDVENYLGFTIISGGELALRFREDVERFKGEGIWIKEGSLVKAVEGVENNFVVKTESSEYRSKTIIIASGRTPKMLNVPGEKELFGKGVATCATCDGPLYKGKEVVVVGGGNSSLDAAFSLMKVAKKVTLVNLSEGLKGDDVLVKNVSSGANVEVINESSVLEIKGKNYVESVTIEHTKTHAERNIVAQGIFIEIGWTPSVDFIPQVAKDKNNQIVVNEFGVTSVPGIWAAGDVNNLWGEQIIIAAGEGAKIALVVAEHIAKLPHQSTSNIHEAA